MLTPSADGYGSDRALIGVVGALLADLDVTVVSAAEGPTLDALRALGADVMVAPDFALRRRFATPTGFLPALARIGRTAMLLRRLHRERRFVGVYVNTVANLILPLVRAAVPAPVVVHVREVPRAGERQNRLFFGQVNRVASVVLTNSTFTADFVSHVEPRLTDRLVVVHDGVDDPGDVARRGASEGPLQIVCVGRLHPQKGQAVLLDAVGEAVARGADHHLHFWGDALAEHTEIEQGLHAQVDALGLAGRVTWHGYSSDVAAMYRGMDVAVVPSTWPEGFSLVTAEAQAAGLATIATAPGGPADIIVDGITGRLVGLGDADEIRAALDECADPDTRSSWGRAGRARYLELFTTERSASGVAAAVNRLVG